MAQDRPRGGRGGGERKGKEKTWCTKHVFITLSLSALVSRPRWHFHALMMSLGVVTELPQPHLLAPSEHGIGQPPRPQHQTWHGKIICSVS